MKRDGGAGRQGDRVTLTLCPSYREIEAPLDGGELAIILIGPWDEASLGGVALPRLSPTTLLLLIIIITFFLG